jgi:ArsR family transcriptional regulator
MIVDQQPSKHEAPQERGNPMVDLVKERQPVSKNTAAEADSQSSSANEPKSSMASSGKASPPQRKPTPAHLNDMIAAELVNQFKLLADETRLRILYFLMHQKELNVRSLCELLDQSQPAVSHHLALLRNASMIDSRRDGKHNFYHLLPGSFQQLIDTLSAISPGMPSEVRFVDYVPEPVDA